MKKTVIAMGLGLMLAGCSSATPEEMFLAEVHAGIIGTEDYPDREVLSLGTSACGAIANVPDRDELVSRLSGTELTDRELYVLLDAAEKYLCGGEEK